MKSNIITYKMNNKTNHLKFNKLNKKSLTSKISLKIINKI